MKIVISKEGKRKITLTKSEWEDVGRKGNWLQVEAKWGKKVDIEQPGKWTRTNLGELKKKRNAAKKRQQKRKEQGKKANPKDTELLRELNFAIRAKTGWGKAN